MWAILHLPKSTFTCNGKSPKLINTHIHMQTIEPQLYPSNSSRYRVREKNIIFHKTYQTRCHGRKTQCGWLLVVTFRRKSCYVFNINKSLCILHQEQHNLLRLLAPSPFHVYREGAELIHAKSLKKAYTFQKNNHKYLDTYLIVVEHLL